MAEVPESLDTSLDRTNLQVNQRCGNCKHLKRIAHPTYGSLCSKLGQTEVSRPCERFSLDPTKIKFKTDRHARYAVKLLNDLSPDKLLLFASMMVEETRTRKYGFTFGQTVYLRAFGGDYISNYRKLKVVSAGRKYVNLVAAEGYTAMVFKDSVITHDQWLVKKRKLENAERLIDPNYKKYTESPSHAQMQIAKVRETVSAQDMDSTNRHDFALTDGRNRITRPRMAGSRAADRERITPLHKLVAAQVRTR